MRLFRSRQELRAADVRDTTGRQSSSAPSEPVLPRTKTNIALASPGAHWRQTGLAIDHLDDRIRRPDDVERLVTAHAGGRPFRPAKRRQPCWCSPSPARAAESYRLLRTTRSSLLWAGSSRG